MMRTILVLAFAAASTAFAQSADWPVNGGGPANTHYSKLDQINRSNAANLKVAWTYDTGDAFADSEMECSPIIVHGVMYASTPKLRVFALNAATGKPLWTFDPREESGRPGKARNRGVTFWESGGDRRVFFVYSHYLFALNADSGKLIPSFGEGGRVDLREGLGRPAQDMFITATSPGIVYKDLLILGSLVSEALPAAPGDIRAFDVRTGKIRWSFHTIPHPGEFGYETWPKDAWKYIGGANNWAGMSLDEKRGMVFASTGSAAFDFYGANRVGDDLFANCILALKADTGERVWHFQGIRHDVWDRDFPAAPSLITVTRDGAPVDAVAQITKSGHVFVLDRDTGKSLFPLESLPYPASAVEGEKLARMQTLPLAPEAFARQKFTADLVTDRTPAAHQAVLERLRKVHSNGQFTPPSLEGTVVFPGFDGGGEWGGPAYDPETHLLYVNSNEMAWILRLVRPPDAGKRMTAENLYLRHCAGCHHADRAGSPPEFPSLIHIAQSHSAAEITSIVANGRVRMPAFRQLGHPAIAAIVDYLVSGKNPTVDIPEITDSGMKFGIDGYNKFLDPDGYPAVRPPWGTLNAINLDSGKFEWKIPFGEYPELAAAGMKNTGSENYGGAVVTAGGLLFIGATNYDRKFHVFDKSNGKLLWESVLPAAGNATPATYEIGGRQFVVIAAGGGKAKNSSGGSYVAFALK